MTIDPIAMRGYGPDSDTGTISRRGYITVAEVIERARAQVGVVTRPVRMRAVQLRTGFIVASDIFVPRNSWFRMRSSLLVKNIYDLSYRANTRITQLLKLPVLSNIYVAYEYVSNVTSDVMIVLNKYYDAIMDTRVPIITTNTIRADLLVRQEEFVKILTNLRLGVARTFEASFDTLVKNTRDIVTNVYPTSLVKRISESYVVKGIKDMTKFIMEFILDEDDEGSKV